jgi:hypothetical protein
MIINIISLVGFSQCGFLLCLSAVSHVNKNGNGHNYQYGSADDTTNDYIDCVGAMKLFL